FAFLYCITKTLICQIFVLLTYSKMCFYLIWVDRRYLLNCCLYAINYGDGTDIIKGDFLDENTSEQELYCY
ncbi:MAG: hypothetical protein J6J23_01975, partial [Clostridia bacterium]|nr:hypothetical protein [Clostridia bacterium]